MSIVPIPPLAGVLDLLSEILNCSSSRQNIWNYRFMYNRRKKWEPKHPWLKHWKIMKNIWKKKCLNNICEWWYTFLSVKTSKKFSSILTCLPIWQIRGQLLGLDKLLLHDFCNKKICLGRPHSHRVFAKSLMAAKEGWPNILIRTFSC